MDSELFNEIVDMADDDLALMDGTTGPVKKAIDGSDVCFALWPDAARTLGVGCLLLKGARRLGVIADSGKPPPKGTLRFSLPAHAIRCANAEMAVAAWQVLGEGQESKPSK